MRQSRKASVLWALGLIRSWKIVKCGTLAEMASQARALAAQGYWIRVCPHSCTVEYRKPVSGGLDTLAPQK